MFHDALVSFAERREIKMSKYSRIFLGFCRRHYFDWLPDKTYLKLVFKSMLGYPLNLKKPETFNEKLQWLKIYNRKDIYTQMVDKYDVKNYVASVIGQEYIIPTLGVWDTFEKVDFDILPDQFVLKCTHDSGGLIICKDKQKFDLLDSKMKIDACLKSNYYSVWREWPYKNVKPRIIAEQYMSDGGQDIKDYKFFVFNGKVKCFKIDFDRFTKHGANYYDPSGKLLPFGEKICPPNPQKNLKMPQNLNLMIELAERLASDQDFLRVDFYEINNRVYFGELTFYPATGMGKFVPEEWDKKLGSWLQLSKK